MFNYNTATKFWGALSVAHSNSIAISQVEIAKFLEEQSSEVILSSIEIDTGKSGVFRVWRDSHLLGRFHRDIANGLWISQPCNYKLTPRFESSDDAVMFIVEMNAFTTAA